MEISKKLKDVPEEIQEHLLSFHPLFIPKVFRAYRKMMYINGIYSSTFGITKEMYNNELTRSCVVPELDFVIIDSEIYKGKTIIFIYTANVLLNTNDTNF
tara:strand:+ start:617 stop:916 length:300 start_codon:yes stop_codon:yes gene_type:complete